VVDWDREDVLLSRLPDSVGESRALMSILSHALPYTLARKFGHKAASPAGHAPEIDADRSAVLRQHFR